VQGIMQRTKCRRRNRRYARWQAGAGTGIWLGQRRVERPGAAGTIFQSGSMGKQFTATAIMMLVEEGKIGLDDKITNTFPIRPLSGTTSPSAVC